MNKKNIENIKIIMKTEDNLKSLIKFKEYIEKLIKDYEHVWTIELLSSAEIPEVFPHSFLKFILVSNNIDKINEIMRILNFKKEKRKIYINSFNAKFKFLNITEGFPVFELVKIE